MMEFFNRLPGFSHTPPGRERVILRYLPVAGLWGSLGFALLLLAIRLAGTGGLPEPSGKPEFLLVGLFFLYWSGLLVVGIAAFIVLVMKGPAYVADAYPLPDAETPSSGKLTKPADK